MTQSNKDSNPYELAEDLAVSLKSTTILIQNLLGDIKDNSSSLAVLREKLESLGDNVESLSHVVREGNGKGSMITRLALIERSVEDIEESFDDLKKFVMTSVDNIREDIREDKKSEEEVMEKEKEFKRNKWIQTIKLIAIIAPGLIALGITLLKMFTTQ